jgi:hypothetical protein
MEGEKEDNIKTVLNHISFWIIAQKDNCREKEIQYCNDTSK